MALRPILTAVLAMAQAGFPLHGAIAAPYHPAVATAAAQADAAPGRIVPVQAPPVVPLPGVPGPRIVPRPLPPVVRRPAPVQRDVWPGVYSRAQVREMQAALNYFGYNSGTPDGVIGGRTRAAVRAYQRSLGRAATGTLTRAQGNRLIADYRAALATTVVTQPPAVIVPAPQTQQPQLSPPPTQSTASALNWHLPADDAEIAWLTRFYANEYLVSTGRNIDWGRPPFLMALADLDGQPGNPAILVHWTEKSFCPAGACQVDVWYHENDDYRRVASYYGSELQLGKDSLRGFVDLMLDGTRLRWTGTEYTVEGRIAESGSNSGTTAPAQAPGSVPTPPAN